MRMPASGVRALIKVPIPVPTRRLFATLAMGEPGTAIEWAAIAFPLSSPFAMIARAAQHDPLWPHALALAWQLVWVLVFIRLGAALFRKRVMNSGPQGAKQNRGLVALVASAFGKRPKNVL